MARLFCSIQKHAYFCTLFVLVNLTSSNQSDSNVLTDYISKQITQSFSSCTLVVTLDDSRQNLVYFSLISSKLKNQAAYTYHFSLDREFDKVVPDTLGKIRRHGDSCKLTLLLINKDFSKYFEAVKQTIASIYQPLTRLDIDYYMLITSPEHHSEILQETSFVKKMKFKVAIGVAEQRLKISAINPFGSENVKPKLIQISPLDSLKSRDSLCPDFVQNLNGYELRVSVPPAKSFLEVTPPPWIKQRNAKRGGWKFLFEDYLMIKFNCTYRVFRSTGKDGKFGTGGSGAQFPNGSWFGVVGDLYNGYADLGVATAQTDRRIEYIGYTDSYFDTGCLTFVTGQPVKVYSTLAMFWPFNIFVWVCITAGTFLSFIFFFGVFKFLQHLKLENSSITLGLEAILILGPYLGQGASKTPHSSTLRTFFALWLFYALVVTTLYQSKLVTLLAFPVLGKLPESFEQLAFSDFEVGFMKNGDSAYNTFARSKDPVYHALVGKMELLPGVNIECLQKVVSRKKYACIAYDFDIEYLHQKNFSDVDTRKLVFSNARTYNIWLGLATAANSIFRVNFGKVLGQTVPFHLAEIWNDMDMYETVRKPKLEWWKEIGQTEKLSMLEESNDTDLTLANIMGVFYTFLVCMLASIFVFCYEVYSAKANFHVESKLKQWTFGLHV